MFEYAITKTVGHGGLVGTETEICAENSRRASFRLQVLDDGVLYCAIGSTAETGKGIMVDADHPLEIQVPVVGSVHVVPGTGEVLYCAAEGLC